MENRFAICKTAITAIDSDKENDHLESTMAMLIGIKMAKSRLCPEVIGY